MSQSRQHKPGPNKKERSNAESTPDCRHQIKSPGRDALVLRTPSRIIHIPDRQTEDEDEEGGAAYFSTTPIRTEEDIFSCIFIPFTECSQWFKPARRTVYLTAVILLAITIQFSISILYVGWQHWRLLLQGEGLIREGCEGTESETLACENSRLAMLFLLASTMDYAGGLISGIVLDTRGSFFLSMMGWAAVFIGYGTMIGSSFFRISHPVPWGIAFAICGLPGSMFNFALMEQANRFPDAWRLPVMNLILGVQNSAQLTMVAVYEFSKQHEVAEIWKIFSIYIGIFGFIMFVLSVYLFRDKIVDADGLEMQTLATGSLMANNISDLFASYIDEPGKFRFISELGSIVETHSVLGLDDGAPYDPSDILVDILTDDIASRFDEAHDDSMSGLPASWMRRKLDLLKVRATLAYMGVMAEMKRGACTEILLVTFGWFMPMTLTRDFYWLNLMESTSDDFAKRAAILVPLVAITTSLTGGPAFQYSPPISIYSTMIVVSMCQGWANLTTMWPENERLLWSGVATFAATIPLIVSARLCYFKWFLSINYGFLMGVGGFLTACCIPLLMLQNISPGVKYTLNIIFRFVSPIIAVISNLFLIQRAQKEFKNSQCDYIMDPSKALMSDPPTPHSIPGRYLASGASTDTSPDDRVSRRSATAVHA